ncbi:DUF882 domain-containing protein [Methylophaga sp.]|uniref:DUF882 domain-containing protein n=1 Tax=Methylophaga sp. TaxID=2024840 RepID=UPI003A8FCB6F
MTDSNNRLTASVMQRTFSRREILRYLAASGAMLMMPAALANLPKEAPRQLSLYNLHTEEKLKATYWADGEYQPDGLADINHLLRDHRSGEHTDMDPQLLNLMFLLHEKAQSKQAFHIISGYRSPASNEMLRKNSTGVAQKSLHTLGMAVDLRLPGIELEALRDMALSLQGGGVGYYPKSDFIHIDTGRVRQW